MTATRIDGKRLAKERRAALARTISARTAAGFRPPGLAVILVGDDPASAVYVRQKDRACREVGIDVRTHRLPADCTQSELLDTIAALNHDPGIDGILCQFPLPPHLDTDAVITAIDPAKDVDGFHPLNIGRLVAGHDPLTACTPQGILHLLDHTGVPLAGRRAVIVGRSALVGKPLFHLLLARDLTVTVAHSRTRDLPGLVAEADILVAAVGQPHLIRGPWVRPGAVVIDVGITRMPDGTLAGDCAPDVAETAGWLTPVPGGVGPMTVAMLLGNTLKAQIARTCEDGR